MDTKASITQDNFVTDSFTNSRTIKRIVLLVVFAVAVGIGLTLTALPKVISAQITNNNNSNNDNKPIIIHVHPHLKLMVDGKPVTLPAKIGIDPSLWKDHSLDQYGMQSMNMVMPAMAPLGTINNSGIIGVANNRNYTLQDFLNIWGIDLTHKNVVISADGRPVTDFKDYVLSNGERLNMTIDGKPVTIPAKIGIDPSLWKDHSLDQYGMQSMNMVMPGMATLHTHDTSGIIHVESNTIRTYTLGEFLNIWGGLDTNGKIIKASVDGVPVSDYKKIILRDGEQINLEVDG